MRKLFLLTLFLAAIGPLTARGLTSADDALAYVAMPLAVSDVCAVRGVQTDQVASLAAYMDQAQVSPEGFIDVFRYVPVALVYSNGRRPDFVQWVGSEVDRGVTGDELVSAMEGRLGTYGEVSIPRTYRSRYEPRYYDVAYEPDYVPIGVRRYCERELIDPFALIDMPVAVADVCDLGVPYERVGRLVVELDLGDVAPWQTVELLRYAPPALLVAAYGQPDFGQYVYDQRVGGLSGYALVRAASQRLLTYGVAPRIDAVPQVYSGGNAYAPVAQNYIDPASPAYVPQTVRTRVASRFGGGSASQLPAREPAAAPVAAPSPEVSRFLTERGASAVVSSPAQARRELARTARAEREAARAYAPQPGFPVAQAPQGVHEMSPRGDIGHGAPMGRGAPRGGNLTNPIPPSVAAARGREARHEHVAAPGGMRTFTPPAGLAQRPAQGPMDTRRGRGHEHVVAAPAAAVAASPQVMPRRGRPQFVSQPRAEQRRVVEQHHVVVQPRIDQPPRPAVRPAVAAPPAPQQQGRGTPPKAVAAPTQQNGAPPAGKPTGEKKKGKDH